MLSFPYWRSVHACGSARWLAHAVIVVGHAALVAAALPSALSAQSGLPATRSSTGLRCLDTAATVTPARLDARHLIYVEQQTVVSQRDGRVLVAGSPVFVWREETDHHELLEVDSLFGMVIDSVSSSVRAIPSPLPGRTLNGMRAAALPDGWWLVTFAEVDRVPMPRHPIVKQMWAGETDGTRWRHLQALPVVGDSLDSMRMSSLVWRDGRARVAVLYPHESWTYGAMYSLDRGRWTVRAENLRLADYVDFSLSATHDLMALVRPSEDGPFDTSSLFLFAKRAEDTAWTRKAWIVVGGKYATREPAFSGDAHRVLTWRRTNDQLLHWDQYYATVDSRGDSVGPVTQVARESIEYSIASSGAYHVWALHDRAKPVATLQLVESDASSEPRRRVALTEYAGLIGVALTPRRVVVVASRPSSNPREPAVISVIQTHTWRCP
jgi:hypothetical protein